MRAAAGGMGTDSARATWLARATWRVLPNALTCSTLRMVPRMGPIAQASPAGRGRQSASDPQKTEAHRPGDLRAPRALPQTCAAQEPCAPGHAADLRRRRARARGRKISACDCRPRGAENFRVSQRIESHSGAPNSDTSSIAHAHARSEGSRAWQQRKH